MVNTLLSAGRGRLACLLLLSCVGLVLFESKFSMKSMLITYKNYAWGGGRSTFDEIGTATAAESLLVTSSYRDLSANALPASGVSNTVCAGFSITISITSSSFPFSTTTSSEASPLSCLLPRWFVFAWQLWPLASALCFLWTQMSLRKNPWLSRPHSVALSTVASFAA